MDGIVTAYGPNHPENDVTRHPELDPESQQFANMASDFQFGQLILLPAAAPQPDTTGCLRTMT